MAVSLTRFSNGARGCDQYSGRELRAKFRREVEARRGRMDVDMMSSDGGTNAWRPVYRPPSNSASEGRLPVGKLRGFPRSYLFELVLSRIRWPRKERWSGPHVCLLLAQPQGNWFPKLAGFEQVVKWSPHSGLIVDRSGSYLKKYRMWKTPIRRRRVFRNARSGGILHRRSSKC